MDVGTETIATMCEEIEAETIVIVIETGIVKENETGTDTGHGMDVIMTVTEGGTRETTGEGKGNRGRTHRNESGKIQDMLLHMKVGRRNESGRGAHSRDQTGLRRYEDICI